MSTSTERQQMMESKSRDQLLEMIIKPEDWMPEIIDAAKIELDRRGEKYAAANKLESPEQNPESVILINDPKWKLDWADLIVPIIASIVHIIKSGRYDLLYMIFAGIGYALGIFIFFSGFRQFIWMNNRKRPIPKPRNPIIAAIIGIIIFVFIV